MSYNLCKVNNVGMAQLMNDRMFSTTSATNLCVILIGLCSALHTCTTVHFGEQPLHAKESIKGGQEFRY